MRSRELYESPGILIFRKLHRGFRFGKRFLVPLFGQIEQSK
jgi:hypothetical protein